MESLRRSPRFLQAEYRGRIAIDDDAARHESFGRLEERKVLQDRSALSSDTVFLTTHRRAQHSRCFS